jgi:hypothetical protein
MCAFFMAMKASRSSGTSATARGRAYRRVRSARKSGCS